MSATLYPWRERCVSREGETRAGGTCVACCASGYRTIRGCMSHAPFHRGPCLLVRAGALVPVLYNVRSGVCVFSLGWMKQQLLMLYAIALRHIFSNGVGTSQYPRIAGTRIPQHNTAIRAVGDTPYQKCIKPHPRANASD